ncbi:MAG TPA: TraB/GumN family protein [Gammaproteobacteria bacterium]
MRILTALLLAFSATLHADPAAWRVGGSGGGLWLLGSVHYLREQDYPLPAVVDELYARADVLVMELDLDDLDAAAVQGSFASAGVLPAGMSLASILDAETYQRTASLAADLGMPMTLLERLEPWLVALTLMDLTMSRLGFRADQGLEQHLMSRAAADQKEILGLESIEDQISIFDSLSLEDQAGLLAQSVEDMESPAEYMSRLLDAWRAGNLDELAEEFSDDYVEYPELEAALVLDRNRRWVTRVQEMLNDDRQFLVVMGALHLVGDDSVVDLLSEQGIEVTPVAAP